jgi:diguanylate cyclase (GGDEF)-like protein
MFASRLLAREDSAEVRHLAYHDPLTGLPNRAQLADRLEEALADARRGRAAALLYLDLNDFKLVNDSLGHAAGDDLLCHVAARLRTVVRAGDMLDRQGGDEFLLLLVDLPPASAVTVAERVAEQIAAVLEDSFTIGDAVFQIGASVGIATCPAHGTDAETLHKNADAAMYRAKEGGGGHAVYEPSPHDPLSRLSLAARMKQGLEAGEFELHYQPIYAIGDDHGIRGVESLIRWRDPERGLVPPLDFIPVAEDTGVIDAIGAWVIEETARQMRRWLDQGYKLNVGVNVSVRQLRSPGFSERTAATLREYGLDPHTWVLELTESAWMLDAQRAMPMLHALRAEGMALALDDFGAGYSSLARLRWLPVQVIKIDRAFMQGLPGDPQACAIVAAIQQLAAACDCDVVAEGIETAEQLEFLTSHGCTLGQGYHLARPAPPDDITPMIGELIVPSRRVAA